jgi:hypothetical protein
MGTAIIEFLMHALSIFFLIGIVGSSVVVLISFVEDIHELFDE